MTKFQRDRLNYFIKEAKKYGWVRLAPGDVELIDELMDLNGKNYQEGFESGKEFVLSGDYENP